MVGEISKVELYWYDSENDVFKPVASESKELKVFVPKIELYWFDTVTSSYKPLITDGTMPLNTDVINSISQAVVTEVEATMNQLEVNALLHGAKGDGVTDDYPTIQRLLDEGFSVYLPYTATGYVISDTLVIRNARKLRGQSRNTVVVLTTNNRPIIRIEGSQFEVSNLYLAFANQQDGTMTGATGIELGNAETSIGAFEGIIEQVIIEKSYRGIAIPTWTGGAFAFMNHIRQVRVLNSWDYSFHLSSTGIGLTMNTLENCYSLHSPEGNPTSKGFYIGNHDNFVMTNCACDHAREDALTLENNFSGTILSFHAEACHISKDWQAIVRIINSNVKFNSLQFPFNIIDAGTQEGYFLWAYDNSTVIIDFMTERDTNQIGTGGYFSVVKDATSTIAISKMTSNYPVL